MKYLAVLGRQPEISMAELEAQLPKDFALEKPYKVVLTSSDSISLAFFSASSKDSIVNMSLKLSNKHSLAMPYFDVDRFGGIIKFAARLEQTPLEYLSSLAKGKITIGVSDYSNKATRKAAQQEALKLKKILVRHGRSVRVVENKEAILSTATSLHNGLNGKNERKVELIKINNEWYRVIWVQDIDAYAKRDQARPARDAKVGMLPPKLAQILINLCGPLKPGSVILDPFCGTGVVLQEAILMGYRAYGTDISERMVEYTEKNLKWLLETSKTLSSGTASRQPVFTGGARLRSRQQPPKDPSAKIFEVSIGNAVSFQWQQPIDAVVCEGYLGKPFSRIPTEMELKEQKQECGAIVRGFLKNLAGQIKKDTSVVIAAPAWLRPDGEYERLDIIDEIEDMGYNVNNKTREGLLYHREGQIIARDILILRKK